MGDVHAIVLPGGGYHRHAPHEGEPVAAWLRGLGYGASVFAYPVLTRHPGPLDAVRAEVRRVRADGARRVVLGDAASWETRRATSLDLVVTPAAPPSFVWHTAEDPVVPVQHSYLLGMALAGADVPHEVHVLPGAVHGVGLAEGTPAGVWTDLAAAWLDRLAT